jgi:hypothetical protein
MYSTRDTLDDNDMCQSLSDNLIWNRPDSESRRKINLDLRQWRDTVSIL